MQRALANGQVTPPLPLSRLHSSDVRVRAVARIHLARPVRSGCRRFRAAAQHSFGEIRFICSRETRRIHVDRFLPFPLLSHRDGPGTAATALGRCIETVV